MKWKKLYIDSPDLPKRELGNAGFDIPSYEEKTIYPGERGIISTGLAFEIPVGWVGLLLGRSGLRFKFQLHSDDVGVIDPNYRGEVKVLVINSSSAPFAVRHSDRIAQMVVVPYYEDEAEEVDHLSDSNRGDRGFGSTGLKELLWN